MFRGITVHGLGEERSPLFCEDKVCEEEAQLKEGRETLYGSRIPGRKSELLH